MGISISFYNRCQNPKAVFTLGHLNDGASYTVNRPLELTASVASPLSPQGVLQNVVVVEGNSIADSIISIGDDWNFVSEGVDLGSGYGSVSVVWTCYDLGVRFGVLVTVRTNGAEESLSPSSTASWQYMLDSSPDQPPSWVCPSETQPIQNLPQGPVALTILPSVQPGDVSLACQIADASASGQGGF